MLNARNAERVLDPLQSDAVPYYKLRSLQGTIQRVHYPRRELTIVGEGAVWRFVVPPDCRMWFDDTPAVLRCFHALDPVTVIFDERQNVKAIYSWQARALAA